jgi:hypothetical protein
MSKNYVWVGHLDLFSFLIDSLKIHFRASSTYNYCNILHLINSLLFPKYYIIY